MAMALLPYDKHAYKILVDILLVTAMTSLSYL